MNWELLDRQSARLYEDLYVLEILFELLEQEKILAIHATVAEVKKVCRRLARTGNTGKGI